MSRKKSHVKKGQDVVVISGVHKGATGKVMQVLPEKGRVLIEGVRMIKKHTRKSQEHPNGAIVEREGTVHISNVKLVENSEEKAPKKSTKTKKKAA